MVTPFDDPQAELVWMFLQSLCGDDLEEGLALLSDDFSYWSIVTRTSFDKETLRLGIELRRQYLPDISIELLRCINEGETVVVEGQAVATTNEGAQYDSPFVCIFDTRDGLIVSAREYSDTRRAAGVFPSRL